MSEDLHYLPFPLPDYLARFVASKLNSPIEELIDGSKVKALHVRPNSAFGKMITRSLKSSDKPSAPFKAFTLYISVSKYVGNHDKKTLSKRYGSYQMSQEDIKDITGIFEQLYYECFYDSVNTAMAIYDKMGKQRGALFTSIEEFMHRYGTPNDPELHERLRKRFQRYSKNRSRTIFNDK